MYKLVVIGKVSGKGQEKEPKREQCGEKNVEVFADVEEDTKTLVISKA